MKNEKGQYLLDFNKLENEYKPKINFNRLMEILKMELKNKLIGNYLSPVLKEDVLNLIVNIINNYHEIHMPKSYLYENISMNLNEESSIIFSKDLVLKLRGDYKCQ